MVYSVVRMTKITAVPMAKLGCGLNMLRSTYRPLVLTPRLASYRLMIIIPITQKMNTKPIRSRKGISYTPAEFLTAKPKGERNYRFIMPGRNLSRIESRKPPMVANSAALDVVFFQKKPRMNIAKMPGDTKPVYS